MLCEILFDGQLLAHSKQNGTSITQKIMKWNESLDHGPAGNMHSQLSQKGYAVNIR